MDWTPSRKILATIFAVGVGIRLVAYFTPGSLWYDELPTALNATRRSWSDLLAPLEYRQVAPLGFLVAEMAGVALMGANEAGLRLFPLLAAITSLFLFWRIGSRFLYERGLLLALVFFSVAAPFVWYARKAKQYAGDLFAALVLMLLALRLLEGRYDARRAWVAGVTGGLVILVSQPTVLLAAGLIAVLLVQKWRARERLLPVVVVGCFWALASVVQFLTTLRIIPPETRTFMTRAWSGAFLSAPTSAPEFLWLPRRLFRFVGFVVALMRPDTPWETAFLSIYAALAIAGTLYLARRRSGAAVLLFTPLAIAVLASALRVLPLTGRVMIYAAPSFVLACVAGLEMLRLRVPRPAVQFFAIALVTAPAVFLPFLLAALNRQEDARTVLQELKGRWRDGDVAYVYGGSVMAMQFYGEPLGLEPWIPGRRNVVDPRDHLRDVDALRGVPRAWLFHTHAGSCRIALLHSYLGTIGEEIDRIEDPHGVRGFHESTARLYALDDPARLARSSASTHPISESTLACRAGRRSIGGAIKARMLELLGR